MDLTKLRCSERIRNRNNPMLCQTKIEDNSSSSRGLEMKGNHFKIKALAKEYLHMQINWPHVVKISTSQSQREASHLVPVSARSKRCSSSQLLLHNNISLCQFNEELQK